MTTLVEELSAQARALPDKDRARLAEELLASLDQLQEADPSANADSSWAQELHRRIAQIEAGTAKLVSAEDVHAEARRLYRQ